MYKELLTGREICDLGNLLRIITTELRNFESKFSTKIECIHNFYTNHWVIETNLPYIAKVMLKSDTGEYYIDDGIYRIEQMNGLYPFVISNQMFLLKCSKPIPKYDEFILTSLIGSKKGISISKGKLENSSFMEKAPQEIIDLEKKKLEDFGFKWELWTKAYLMYDPI
jgi:Valyl tRNA synthetase tRNA binding arm